MPEQLDMQALAKQNVKQANINKLDQVQWSNLSMQNLNAMGLNQSSGQMREDQKQQIERMVTDMNRALQSKSAAYQTSQRQSTKAALDGSTSKATPSTNSEH